MRPSPHLCRLVMPAATAALVAAGLGGSPMAAPPLAAQGAARTAPPVRDPLALDSAAFAAYGWREIGPYRGGRSVAVAGSIARPDEYWMGTTGGGVFRSTNGGRDWEAVTDRYFGGSVGAITVDERDPDIVWVGTGETPIRGNVTHGDGLYRTANGGKTWEHMGLRDTRQIARVRLHPTNPNRVYVAALGNVFLPTKERGVYRSDDAGRTWQQILFRDDSTGAIELVMDPSNPEVMYASLWQAGRTPWTLSSGGKGSGIFKSTDGGDSWTEISRARGLPQEGVLGKIGLAVSPANPQRLWALIEHDSGGIYRSDDGGRSWAHINDDRSMRQRAWYYSRVFADPKDTNTVYALNVSFFRSTDGGKTFRTVATPHADNHDLWIAPDDAGRMIEGNDGGANVSTDTARTWTEQDYATAQMYHVTTTNHFPYRICGAQQDNSTLCGPSRNPGGITMGDWEDAGGGESGYIAADPRNPDIVYAGSYGGLLTRKDMRTGLTRNVSPWPLNPMGQSSEDIEYRFQWTFPIVFSRHTPGVLYAGGSVLFRTTDEGQSWEIASPPLGRNDPKTMGPSGGPITRDQTGVETYGTIFTFDESPITPGLLWAGSDDGLIHVSRDNARTWQAVTPPTSLLPDFARISIIEPSPHDPGTAYVAANRYQMGDMRPYLLKTTDYGQSWTLITGGIEGDGEFTRVVRADPERRGLLFAGTERGVWISFDDGARWQRLPVTLPPVPVHDMVIKEGDLVVATHGRSFYVLDDLSTIRQLEPALLASAAHLFEPRDAYRTQWSGRRGRGGGTMGQNPASGAVVRYWLKDAGRPVALEFLDTRGQLIQRFESDTARRDSTARQGQAQGGRGAPMARPSVPNAAGLNEFAWNLRYPDASTFRGIVMWAGSTVGPVAPPGTYQVRMLVDGQPVATRSLAVLKDPRTGATEADLLAQFELLVEIRDAVTASNDAVRTIRNVKYQMAEREKSLKGADSASFAAAAAELARRMGAVEEELYQVRNQSSQDPLNYPIKLNNKIAALTGHVSSSEAAPTAQSRQVFGRLKAELDAHLATLAGVMGEGLPKVNGILTRAGQQQIVPSTEELGPARQAPDVAGELKGANPLW